LFKIKSTTPDRWQNSASARGGFHMPRGRDLLIVIADGEHVRFVRPAADNALHSEASLDSPSAHKQSSDLGSDHPGASLHTGSTVHHALAPRHDPHALEKEKFAASIAQQLNVRAAGDGFDDLVVVAPPHVLQAIRGALDTTTEAKVIGVLAKDLVKTPDSDLWPHVQAWVKPVHRSTV
jgi:protein required for attachment to host cells